ncbi:hypothetical protein ACQP25_00180 [Microtetraspora malaysiensis]|uniref:hypothetical protein n=1 Tax=Microtetraspora malaysiensis TaxID=161358 RepID=UPI003D92398A
MVEHLPVLEDVGGPPPLSRLRRRLALVGRTRGELGGEVGRGAELGLGLGPGLVRWAAKSSIVAATRSAGTPAARSRSASSPK